MSSTGRSTACSPIAPSSRRDCCASWSHRSEPRRAPESTMSLAIVRWIAGPVLHAVKQGPFSLREAVRVGPQALLGEVVRIHDDQIVVQVYEDTTGLRPGSEVHGDGQPLAIRLGPGLLGHIFDGL